MSLTYVDPGAPLHGQPAFVPPSDLFRSQCFWGASARFPTNDELSHNNMCKAEDVLSLLFVPIVDGSRVVEFTGDVPEIDCAVGQVPWTSKRIDIAIDDATRPWRFLYTPPPISQAFTIEDHLYFDGKCYSNQMRRNANVQMKVRKMNIAQQNTQPVVDVLADFVGVNTLYHFWLELHFGTSFCSFGLTAGSNQRIRLDTPDSAQIRTSYTSTPRVATDVSGYPLRPLTDDHVRALGALFAMMAAEKSSRVEECGKRGDKNLYCETDQTNFGVSYKRDAWGKVVYSLQSSALLRGLQQNCELQTGSAHCQSFALDMYTRPKSVWQYLSSTLLTDLNSVSPGTFERGQLRDGAYRFFNHAVDVSFANTVTDDLTTCVLSNGGELTRYVVTSTR